MKQQSFSSLDHAHTKKRTKREVFLGEMDAVVPWTRLEALIAPHYPGLARAGGGRDRLDISGGVRRCSFCLGGSSRHRPFGPDAG